MGRLTISRHGIRESRGFVTIRDEASGLVIEIDSVGGSDPGVGIEVYPYATDDAPPELLTAQPDWDPDDRHRRVTFLKGRHRVTT